MRHLAALALALSACGQGIANIKSIGDGNEALLVNAEADFNGNDTQIRVEVFRDGQRLDDAQALVEIAEGEEGALQATQFQGNRFELDLNGYAQELRLVVTAGADNVDAVFNGPSPVLITSPLAGDTVAVSEGEDIRVEWEGQDNDGATEVEVAAGGFRITLIGDPGRVEIPFFDVDAGVERVFVTRSNVPALGGGAPGSVIRISAGADADLSLQ
jgi:hypothetical protein